MEKKKDGFQSKLSRNIVLSFISFDVCLLFYIPLFVWLRFQSIFRRSFPFERIRRHKGCLQDNNFVAFGIHAIGSLLFSFFPFLSFRFFFFPFYFYIRGTVYARVMRNKEETHGTLIALRPSSRLRWFLTKTEKERNKTIKQCNGRRIILRTRSRNR